MITEHTPQFYKQLCIFILIGMEVVIEYVFDTFIS